MLKATDKGLRARDVLACLGYPQEHPTLVLSDSDAALRTAAGESTAARLRHDLRRKAILTQRVVDGDFVLAHVPDAGNVVDWMTKWVKHEKLLASLAFLTGAKARALHEAAGVHALASYNAMVASVHDWVAV